MAMTDRLQVILPPDLHQLLKQRAAAEAKSVGQLLREYARFCLELPARAERIAAADRLCALELPVADWETMEQ